MAAIITLTGHSMGKNITYMRASESLLSLDVQARFLPYSDDFEDSQGAYMFYDDERGCFVRTGKANSIGKRLKEHRKCADAVVATSKFYLAYPTEEAHKKRGTSRDLVRGRFEHLRPFIALSWKKDMGKQVTELFTWSPNVSKELGIQTKRQSTVDKKVELVTYLVELIYELMLDPNRDVSENPGFETVLRTYAPIRAGVSTN